MVIGVHSRIRLLARHPSALLLAAQLVALLAYPFLDTSTVGRAVIGVVGTVVVLLALWAVRRTPALSWVALLLGGPALVTTALEATHPQDDPLVLVNALLHAPFYFYISYGMIRYLFHDQRVTRDELHATGAAFTVVAWGFAYVYAAVQVVWPGSFAGLKSARQAGDLRIARVRARPGPRHGRPGRPRLLPGRRPQPLAAAVRAPARLTTPGLRAGQRAGQQLRR